ncbi:hypothetical protein [Henriciella litoralis]|uniref:hypothetical protein n=1 Tax=Henriciella litoralis TaxID=568102 RepID=UPI000A05B4B6|nr:hypothetical protein [Henriciella litoralis]
MENNIAPVVNEYVSQIPPEAWPLIETVLRVTAVVTVIWLAITLFILLRRNASNLTPVHAARKDQADQPDFLTVDQGARREALARGDQFGETLKAREDAEAKAAKGAVAGKPISLAGQIFRGLSFLMSLFSLLTMIIGSIWQIGRMGNLMKEYNTVERITTVIEHNPVSFTMVLLVSIYAVWCFIRKQSSQKALA